VKAKARFVFTVRRSALLLLSALALLLIPASEAFAEIAVELKGSGAGRVTSNQAGSGGHELECSNVGGGAPGPRCSEEFPSFGGSGINKVGLTAVAGEGSFFAGWAGEDEFTEFLEGSPNCNQGHAQPCFVIDVSEAFGGGITTHIAALFKAIPSVPPAVTTGGSGPGANQFLTTLEGAVNPGGFEVEECRFEYGPSAKYGISAPCTPSAAELGEGTEAEEVSAEAELEELKPNTTYHYRVVASNLGGTAKGEDRTFTTGPPPSEEELPASDQECGNKAIREKQVFGAILLPDCMTLEMVSPPQKGSQGAFSPAVSAEGERVIFLSIASLDDTPGGVSPGVEPYVATRGPSGWSTASTSAPVDIVGGWDGFATALSYTPDFSRWFQVASNSSQFRLGISRAFQGGLGGLFTPISPLFGPLGGGTLTDVNRIHFQGASADHSHLYFVPDRIDTAYLSGDSEPRGEAADANPYLAQLDADAKPSLELLARDSAGETWGGSCGARLGGIRSSTSQAISEPTGARNQGAISADGRRVYFSTRPSQPEAAAVCDNENKLRILERLESKTQGVHIEELFSSECNRADCSSADGNDYYQGASSDGSLVYFTTNRQLADSDLDEGSSCSSELGESAGCDLYLYDSSLPPGQRLIQVSAGGAGDATAGEGAKVLNGVTAISGDGSHVYFVAQGVLTTDKNPEEEEAQEGRPNLYVWDRETEATAFIGILDPSDGGVLWGERGVNGRGVFGGIYPVPELGDGHILTFKSKAALTADDGDGTHSDVFRYDTESQELECVSCTGVGDSAPFDASGGQNLASLGTDSAEQRRQAGEDGETVVFQTAEGLVPGDVNGTTDYYLWRQGKLYRLPGKIDETSSVAISGKGSTIAFLTPTALLPQDGDTAVDVYAARAEGGYPEPEEAARCQADASLPGAPCQEKQPQPPSPNLGAPPPGAGNVPPPRASCPKGKRKVSRKGKVRCIARHTRKRHSARHANANRRTAK
jgi:hypothetical protein